MQKLTFHASSIGVRVLALSALAGLTAANTASAQQQVVGPPGGLAVEVVGGTLDVAGEVTVNENIYSALAEPECDATNRCYAYFPAIPAGQALRVSRVHGNFFSSAPAGFVALRTGSHSSVPGESLIMFPVSSFSAAFEGGVLAFNQDTDVIIAAGQQPILVLGTLAGDDIGTDVRNRVGITGTLIDVP